MAVMSSAAEPDPDALSGSGYLVLRCLLSPARLRQAQALADRVVATPGGLSCRRPNNTLIPLRWDDPLVALLLAECDRIAAAVAACDLRWISGYVSVKEPHSPPLWWHQDWWAWDHPVSFQHAPAQLAVLCYLADTTAGTGALRVIPGSHAASVSLHRVLPQAHSDESAALELTHPAMGDDPAQVSLELRAGDAAIIDYRLLHGTHANAGSRRRDCVLLSFAPHWRALPDDVKAHLICHPALPGAAEAVAGTKVASLLPRFDGRRRDLPLNRDAPATFAIAGA